LGDFVADEFNRVESSRVSREAPSADSASPVPVGNTSGPRRRRQRCEKTIWGRLGKARYFPVTAVGQGRRPANALVEYFVARARGRLRNCPEIKRVRQRRPKRRFVAGWAHTVAVQQVLVWTASRHAPLPGSCTQKSATNCYWRRFVSRGVAMGDFGDYVFVPPSSAVVSSAAKKNGKRANGRHAGCALQSVRTPKRKSLRRHRMKRKAKRGNTRAIGRQIQ